MCAFCNTALAVNLTHTPLLGVFRFRFEAGNYEIANPILSQYQAFNQITRRFIAEGSQDEINIRCSADFFGQTVARSYLAHGLDLASV